MEQIAARFGRAIDVVERSRAVIIGNFDLFTSLTAHTTNELVKGQTYGSVVIGLCGVVAALQDRHHWLSERCRRVGDHDWLDLRLDQMAKIILNARWQ